MDAELLLNALPTLAVVLANPEGFSRMAAATVEELERQLWEVEIARAAYHNTVLRETVLCLWGDL